MIKKLKVLLVLICVAVLAMVMVGCNESYKTDAVSTDTSDATVTSNGGLAVRYGKYLYYVNGYAGIDVDNTYGEVVKGAIARVELDASGDPILDTNRVIVSKNVYNTVLTSGLFIDNGYIYYSTPSVDKDSKGAAKTAEMWLMRTKLDGTGTKVIAEFDDYTAVYKVCGNRILYVNSSNELHSIDLTNKKFKDTKIDEDISSYYFTKATDTDNSFNNVVFYLKASENENDYFNVLWAYTAESDSPQKIADGSSTNFAQYPTGVKMTLVEGAYLADNKIKLVFTLTDGGANTTSSGTYSYDFDSTLAFSSANLVRYSNATSYTDFNVLNSNNILVNDGTNLVLLTNVGGVWGRTVIMASDVDIQKIVDTADGTDIYYLSSSVIYKLHILSKTGESYALDIESASKVFDATYNTTWLTLDLVGDKVFFFNTGLSDYTFYVDLAKVVDRDADSRTAKLIGIVSAADEITLLTK